jgi:hypothetical protein
MEKPEGKNLEDLGVYGKILLKMYLKERRG